MSTLEPNSHLPSPTPVTLATAFWYWLKLGFISFGGPAGQIAIMHHDLVTKKHWISDKRFLHALNYCMVLPGPEAQQLATYIGWLMHRTWGGIIAGGLFVLPSFFILVGLAWINMAYGQLPLIAGVFYGIKPAVVAIVFFAAYRIGGRTLKNRILYGLAIAALIAIALLHVPFPAIILVAAMIGYLSSRQWPTYFRAGSSHQTHGSVSGTCLINDDTPPPAHAMFRWRKLVLVGTIGLGLWGITMGALIALYGWSHSLTQIGWFFSKAAMLTFGGAYAVLPYVFQGAVQHYHWLTPIQMMDGLALGETTPGPLVMVITYVGFVAGWMTQVFGTEHIVSAALVAASIATWVTFLPSFVMIFMGGPLIESTHGNLALTAPLTAITAAVVGVIVNLALFFAYHVVWPSGFAHAIDWPAALLTLLALACLIRWKMNTIHVILGAGLIGAGLTLLGLW